MVKDWTKNKKTLKWLTIEKSKRWPNKLSDFVLIKMPITTNKLTIVYDKVNGTK